MVLNCLFHHLFQTKDSPSGAYKIINGRKAVLRYVVVLLTKYSMHFDNME